MDRTTLNIDEILQRIFLQVKNIYSIMQLRL